MGGYVGKYAFLPPSPNEIERQELLSFVNTSRGHRVPVYHIQRPK